MMCFLEVVFHVSTLMPNHSTDPQCLKKKLHIGNDFVVILFNDSGSPYKLNTISGKFAYVVIVVEPEDEETLAIKLFAKDEVRCEQSLVV